MLYLNLFARALVFGTCSKFSCFGSSQSNVRRAETRSGEGYFLSNLKPNELPKHISPNKPTSGSSLPVLGRVAGASGAGAAAGAGAAGAGVMTATKIG